MTCIAPRSFILISRTVAVWFDTVISRLYTRSTMDNEFELALWMISLVFFTAWLSWLSGRLNAGLSVIDGSEAGVQEIGEALSEVIGLLQQLPAWMKEEVKDYVPQFHMISSPLAPLIEAIVKNISGEQPLKAYEGTRNAEGEFIGTPEIEETQDTT